MASDAQFRLSPDVLHWARISRGFSIEDAAKKAGVPSEKFEAWERGEKTPTYKQLEKLAESVYKRPVAMLFLQTPPKEDAIKKDFRNFSNAEMNNLSPEIRLALRKAKRYQLILEETGTIDATLTFSSFHFSINNDPINAAKKLRKYLGLTIEEQKAWKPENALTNFRNQVEAMGISVFQMDMPIYEARAFCLTGKYPLIVLNIQDSKNARVFSLFHEVCHIFFNVSGVFKDLDSGALNRGYSEVELFCNQFAAAFLVPDKDFDNELNYLSARNITSNDYEINKLAKLFNVSNEVVARKLLTRSLITEDFFWARKRLWDSAARAAKETEKAKLKEQEVSGIKQDVKMVNEKGYLYLKSVINAYQQGIISSSDLSSYLESKLDHLPNLLKRLNP